MSQPADMLVVTASGQRFALPAAAVRAVAPLGPLTRVPLQPAELLGLACLRGEIIAVLDLARRLGLDSAGEATACRFLVAVSSGGGETCGLAVDDVSEAARLDAAAPGLPAPAHGPAGAFAGWLQTPLGLAEALNVNALCDFGTTDQTAG